MRHYHPPCVLSSQTRINNSQDWPGPANGFFEVGTRVSLQCLVFKNKTFKNLAAHRVNLYQNALFHAFLFLKVVKINKITLLKEDLKIEKSLICISLL